jgi:multidrug efflux pump subunit AcrA (membrane-fusion protein)
METEVDVPNPGYQLIPGMYAEASITLEQKSGALAVPLQAVSNIENKPAVLTVTAGKRLELRPVKIGIETPDKIEIVSGLSEGDLVVIGRQDQLKAGQLVEPKLINGAKE